MLNECFEKNSCKIKNHLDGLKRPLLILNKLDFNLNMLRQFCFVVVVIKTLLFKKYMLKYRFYKFKTVEST